MDVSERIIPAYHSAGPLQWACVSGVLHERQAIVAPKIRVPCSCLETYYYQLQGDERRGERKW